MLLRSRPRDAGAPGWLLRAREMLRDNLREPLRLADVASELGTTPVRLARAFRRVFGQSPGDYVRQERIRLACERLADPKATISGIALELGFADQSHFTRVFRRHIGTSPGAFRRGE